MTDIHKGLREGGHTVALVDWSRAVRLGAAHGCLGWLLMEALGGSHGVSLSLVWCGCVFMAGMKLMVIINENPPLKTITKQKIKWIENCRKPQFGFKI